MLRFKILASVVPLAVAAFFARGELFRRPRPCIAVADMSVQLTSLSWQAERHVSFTNDPALATVRVQITDNAEAADFAVIDDIDNAEAGGCQTNPATQLVSISAQPAASEPVIYLSTRRSRRLPDLRALEDLFGARCRRPDRRRPRRPPPHPGSLAVTTSLTLFSSRRASTARSSNTSQDRQRIVTARHRATSSKSGNWRWDGHSGSNCTSAAFPAGIPGWCSSSAPS